MSRFRLPRMNPGWIVGAVAALSTTLSTPALADEPTQSEAANSPRVYPPPNTQPNLILIGAGVTVGWYGAAFGLSYLWPDAPHASAMRIPVAGPYIAFAHTGCSSAEPDCGTFTLVLRTVLTGLTAIGQTGGVLAMAEGIFLRTSQPGDSAPPKSAQHLPQFQFSPVAPAPLVFTSTTNPSLDRPSHGTSAGSRTGIDGASQGPAYGFTISGRF